MHPTVLFVPGLRDHVSEHWQTIMAAELPGSRTVAPLERDKLSREARVEALDRAIVDIDGPVVLAAHSAGCLMVAHWAETHDRPIAGALLATPADVETPLPEGYPSLDALGENGWLPTPRKPLPFRTVVAASTNDPLSSLDRTVTLATEWKSKIVLVGDVGHLNPAAGFGSWAQGKVLLNALVGPGL